MKTWESTAIPASKDDDGEWVHTYGKKADLLASTFRDRFLTPLAEHNEYSECPYSCLSQPDIWDYKHTCFLSTHLRVYTKVVQRTRANNQHFFEKVCSFRSWANRDENQCYSENEQVVWTMSGTLDRTQFEKCSACNARNRKYVHLMAQLLNIVERIMSYLNVPTLQHSIIFSRN